jgi:aryl-alcohol dehydrogenase
MEGRFPVDRLIRYFDFNDINEAIEAQKRGEVIKPVLRFS